MKTYAIVLIVCGSVAAALVVLCCLCNLGRKKKTKVPTSTRPQIIRPPLRDRDLEIGKTSKTANNDGGMVILAGAAASVATAAVIVSASGGGGGGDSGGGDGGGGCGGGGCGGGGCGGGCGG